MRQADHQQQQQQDQEPALASSKAWVEAKELKAGDLVLIGTMHSPEAMAWREVENVRLVFGLNTLIRFKDGTERALRDNEQLETIEARA